MRGTKLFRIAAGAITAGLLTVGLATPASAEGALVIRSVDTTSFPNVAVQAQLPVGTKSGDVTVSQNGQAVSGAQVKSFADAGTATGVVLLLDASSASSTADALTKEKNAAKELIASAAPGQEFAVVAYNTTARQVVGFTADAARLNSGIDNLTASGDAALWDGVRVASALFGDRPDLQANLLVMNASASTASTATASSALEVARDAKASVSAIAIGSTNEGAALQQVAAATQGSYAATSADELGAATQNAASQIRSQVVVSYTSPDANAAALDITLAAGGASVTSHASAGTLAQGTAATPTVVESRNLGPFSGTVGVILLGLVALAAVGLLAWGIASIVVTERNQLSRALRPYNTDKEEERDFTKLADSEFIKKAVAETQRIAEERGFLETIERRLEQAQIPLKPAEALFFTVAIAFIAMLGGAFLGGILGMALAGLIFGYLPIAVTSFRANARRRKFNKQLPDTLQLLAGSLRAGYSLIQGLDAVAKQVDSPMKEEFQRALSEARLGRPVDEALQEVSDRMQSDDFEWAVMAIKIQREVGGNLAELLMTVSETMLERERLRREVRALTAEGRMSAIVLVVLPPGIGLVVSFLNPAYMQPMFQTLIGQVALVAAGILMGVGYWAMNKLTKVEA